MKLNIKIRRDMLEKVRESLIAEDGTQLPDPHPSNFNKKIIFKDSGGVELCRIPFNGLELVISASSSATYKFVFTDLTNILRGTASVSGTVSTFEIQGLVETGPDVFDKKAIEGTVGGPSSMADIKINRLSWTADSTTITISDLRLLLPQGA